LTLGGVLSRVGQRSLEEGFGAQGLQALGG